MSRRGTSSPLGADAETWAKLCTDRLLPQSPASGGVANARRPDGSWVRGCVYAACAILKGDGFVHDVALEAEVEETFRLERHVPPVLVGRGEYDPEALAAAHRERCHGEQLALG